MIHALYAWTQAYLAHCLVSYFAGMLVATLVWRFAGLRAR